MNLTDERLRLYLKLDRLWDWLEANEFHPRHNARHDVYVSTLRKYERVCDEIDGRDLDVTEVL